MLSTFVRSILLSSCLTATVALSAAAQSASLTGRVLEAATGSPLGSATVVLEGAGVSGLTNARGVFLLRGLAPGTYQLVTSYLGYATDRTTVQVEAGRTTETSVSLATEAVELDELVVYGAATRGQAEALQRQKTALNITNVVSEELFTRFPDRNAAETVRRLPGISVDRDQGEGEFVQIRGIDQEFNSLTINGIRIPAPDEGDGQRSVGLDLINNDLLGEVEVIKALTPNMDADAVGGVVNFGLRTAPDGNLARISAGVGLNSQTSDFDTYGRGIQDVAGVVGQRFSEDRFGLVVDGAFYRTARHSKLREFEYDDGDGSIDDLIFAQHTNDYDLVRQRFGFSGTGDVRLAPGSEIYATASYNVYLDDEVRRVADFNLDDERETRETRNRLEDQRVQLFMVGGEHDLGRVVVDYKGAWIQASEELPDRTYLRYRRDNPFAGLTNDQVKRLDGSVTFAGLDAPTLDRIRWDDMTKLDRDLSGQLNVTLPLGQASSVGAIQVGGKVLQKEASYERVRFQMTDFTRTEQLAEGAFGFEDMRYDNPGLASLLTDWGNPRNQDGDYAATETVTAAYAMATLHPTERFSALFGVRYERTETDFMQPFPETQDTPLTGTGGYDNVLPSVHLTFRPRLDTNVRLAYSSGLARPRYVDLVPRRVVDDEDRTITYGNPDLEPRTAHNFDLMLERYTSGLGALSAGVFYKRFQAFHTTRVFTEDVGGVPFQARQTVMGDGTASYFGVEVGFNQRLAALIPALSDFSLFGNYNYTWSEGEVDGRTLPMTNSPKHTANLSVLYDDAVTGLSIVVAANYRDALLIGTGGAEHRDVYFDREFHLDLSAVKDVTSNLSVQAQLNGLTAQQEREILGDPGSDLARVLQWEEYGPYGTVSVQYTFR